MTMTTAEYVALQPRERFALIEEHIFGRRVLRDWPCGRDPECGNWSAYEFADSQGKPYLPGEFLQIPTTLGSAVIQIDQEWPPVVDEDGYAVVDLEPVRDFDEPNGWWEIVLEMERKDWEYCIENIEALASGEHMVQFQKPKRSRIFEHANIALAVQVASMRAIGFLVD